VTVATSTTLKFYNNTFDQYFAANGYLLPQKLTDQERPYMLFEWGANGATALDALIDLLGRSSTTMTWVVHCGQSGDSCGLGMSALEVGPTKVIVSHDRCVNCQPISKK
jgi:hypothetical protein